MYALIRLNGRIDEQCVRVKNDIDSVEVQKFQFHGKQCSRHGGRWLHASFGRKAVI